MTMMTKDLNGKNPPSAPSPPPSWRMCLAFKILLLFVTFYVLQLIMAVSVDGKKFYHAIFSSAVIFIHSIYFILYVMAVSVCWLIFCFLRSTVTIFKSSVSWQRKKSSGVIIYFRAAAREQKTLGTFVKPYSHIGIHRKQCCLHASCFIVDDGFLYGADVIFIVIIIISYFTVHKNNAFFTLNFIFSCFFLLWLAFSVHWRVAFSNTHSRELRMKEMNACACVWANI